MQINGAGQSGVHPEPPIVPTANAPLTSQTNPESPSLDSDTVGSLLQQLSSAPVALLIAGIEANHPATDPAIVTSLLQTAVTAVLHGDAPAALTALAELVQRSPEHVERLAGESSLSPIRAQVQELLTRVTTAAKLDAEVRLQAATQAVESTSLHGQGKGDWNPKEVVPVAAQLIDSGRHSNILLATDLSQAVINYYGGFEIASPRAALRRQRPASEPASWVPQAPWTGAIGTVADLLKSGWQRSPVLLLFLVWVALGLTTAIAAGIELWSVNLSLEVWGAGSAGLLGYGTYKRIRARRQPNAVLKLKVRE
jgi:hypothetical protein